MHIATPHDQHVQPAIDCLAAGVNVLSEKPVAHTMSEAWRLVEAAERPGSPKIGVCFQNRYNLTSRAIHAKLRGGNSDASVLRPPSSGAARRPTTSPPVAGPNGPRGRRGPDQPGHPQSRPAAVAARRGRRRHWLQGRLALEGVIEVEDSALLVLDHAGGARTVFAASNANAADSIVTMEIMTESADLFLRHDLAISYADGRDRNRRGASCRLCRPGLLGRVP